MRARATELSLSWLPERCRTTKKYLEGLQCQLGIAIRTHGTTLYASQFRFDDTMLVNIHAYGAWACHSPVYQLQRSANGRLFDFYAGAFERSWNSPRERDTPER